MILEKGLVFKNEYSKRGEFTMEVIARDLIKEAIREEVSDIHLLPSEEGYALYFRHFGQMDFVDLKPLDWGKRLISYFKYLANLDVGEKRKPQSGAIHYQFERGRVELRLSTITNVDLLESLVIRVLRHQARKESEVSLIFPWDLERVRRLVSRKSGLILFSGPVGSGKTTTIYQLLRDRLTRENLQVITMEDPVEIIEKDFLQTEVNQGAGITYDVLIKASLRHHPDILLIGEIRDEETAKMVIRGALTGHLMIATIHAKNSLGVIGRLQELSVSNQQISQTVIGIISQRLIPLETSGVSRKRSVILEILEGENLADFLKEGESSFMSLNHKLRRAWACGYITRTTYDQFEVV